MGSSYSKSVPLKSVTSRMLSKRPSQSKKKYVLSPNLCGAVLRKSNLKTSPKDVQNLKEFLARQENMTFSTTLKSRKYDSEIAKSVDGRRKKMVISKGAQKHLEKILRSTKRGAPILLTSVVLPCLENVHRRQLIICGRQKSGVLLKLMSYLRSLFKLELTPGALRREPKSLKAKEGLERAHKLSLFLAVQLWTSVYGHTYIHKEDRDRLKEALAFKDNVYHTCAFANRTLHVKYDNEIAQVLKQQQNELSPGAKMRVRQVNSVLAKLNRQSDSRKVKDFSKKSAALLQKHL